MAKTQSTSKSGVSRNRKRLLTRLIEERKGRAGKPGVAPRSGAKRHAAGREGVPSTLEAALMQGRERLANAESILACLHVALLYADDRSIQDSPDYASAAALALAMLRGVRDQLDDASLKPLLEAQSGRKAVRRTQRR